MDTPIFLLGVLFVACFKCSHGTLVGIKPALTRSHPYEPQPYEAIPYESPLKYLKLAMQDMQKGWTMVKEAQLKWRIR